MLSGQSPVQAVGGHQFLMGSLSGDASLLQHENLIGLHHRGQTVGDDQGGASKLSVLEKYGVWLSMKLLG